MAKVCRLYGSILVAVNLSIFFGVCGGGWCPGGVGCYVAGSGLAQR